MVFLHWVPERTTLTSSDPASTSIISFQTVAKVCSTEGVWVTITHLMELELESKHVAEGLMFTHVGFDEGDEELILVRATLVHF